MRRREQGESKQQAVAKAAPPAQTNAGGRRMAVLGLQRSIGNRNVGRLLAGQLAVQPKLKVGPAGDRYEREADVVADDVMRNLSAPPSAREQLDDDERRVSRVVRRSPGTGLGHVIGLEGGPVDANLERQIGSARSGGQSLPASLRGSMEGAFGSDLSGVRVHAGTQADSLNRSMQSKAFTLGSDIFFAKGQYQPGSTSGQHLLAHELTHTLQQGDRH